MSEKTIDTPTKRSSRLAIKFAWRTGLAMLVLFVGFGVVIGIITHNDANRQINENGVRMVNILASIDYEYWKLISDQENGVSTLTQDYKAKKLSDRAIQFKPNPLEDAISVSGESTQHLIRAAVYTGDSDKYDVLLQHETIKDIGDTLRFSDETEYRQTKVKISEGAFTGGDGYPVRQFRKAIFDAQGKEKGYVVIFLSTEEISRVTRAAVFPVMIVCLIALVLAILLSLLLSAMVTRPVRKLVHDMTIVAKGNLDHKAWGFSNNEIGSLATTFNVMTKELKEAQVKEVERKAFERELSIATEIQAALLPDIVPQTTHLDIGALYKPAKEVGGDYYDFIPVDEDHIGFIVADVSGKGIPGSMVMTMLRSLIRYEAADNPSAAQTLCRTNKILTRDIKRGMFVTAFYIIAEHKTGKIKLSCAGHNPVLYWHARSEKIREIKSEGLALGVAAGERFDEGLQEVVVNMEPGDRVVMYTDGITEAMNPNGIEFGEARFAKLLSEYRNLSADHFGKRVLEALDIFTGGGEAQDDITLVNFIFRG